jgi:phage-related protein (TIGR01555 family)
MMEFQQPWPAQPWLGPFGMADSLQNIVSGLGTAKDPRTANVFTFRELNRFELESAYRSDWVARIVVDAPADDATREWREWQANQDQIAAIEKLEQGLFLQRKMRQALVRARLYGGACLMIGVKDGAEPEEPLKIENIGKGDLRYIVVLNRYELNAGPRIYDVASPWYTRPQYYSISTPLYDIDGKLQPKNWDPADPLAYTSMQKGDPAFQQTPNSGLVRVHPSRIIEFAGNELPDWRLAPLGGGWGDSVLQTVDDALKDWAMTVAGIASMVNDAKVDVISVPGLSERASSQKYRDKLIQRFSVANLSKSINNSLLIDKDELWERIKTRASPILGASPERLTDPL